MPSLNKSRRRGRITNRKTLRKNLRRTKSEGPRKKSNEEEIGSGGFGIVSRPPAKCEAFYTKNVNFNAYTEAYYGDPNYISKLTEYSSAKHELDIGNVIRDTIDNYHYYYCLVEFICPAPKDKIINISGDEYNTYAIAPYCGVTLDSILRRNVIAPLNVFQLCNLVPALQFLISGILKLHMNHIYHKDIHEENVLYDPEYNVLRLIDFGLADNYSNAKNTDSFITYQELHDMEQVVENLIIPLCDYLLETRIADIEIRKQYPFINDFYIQIREFNGKINSVYLNPRGQPKIKRISFEDQLNRYLQVILHFKRINNIDELAEGYNREVNYKLNL